MLVANVNNMTKNPLRWIVATIEDNTREFWYYTCFSDKEEAIKFAKEIEGVVLENV